MRLAHASRFAIKFLRITIQIILMAAGTDKTSSAAAVDIHNRGGCVNNRFPTFTKEEASASVVIGGRTGSSITPKAMNNLGDALLQCN